MALELVYAPNIRIIAQYRSGGQNGAPIDAPQQLQQPFVDGTRKVLSRGSGSSDSFRRLLTAIIGGRHVVNIYMARSKDMALPGMRVEKQAERNATADTLNQLLLTRAEGTAYASSRAGIAETINNALQEPSKQGYRKLLAQVLAPPDVKAVNLEFGSWGSLIRKNVVPSDQKRSNLEQLLKMGVEIIQKEADQQGEAADAEPAASKRPFGCEVFTADGVYARETNYLPLWQKLPNNKLHLENALSDVPDEGDRRARGSKIRNLLRRDVGPLDEAFLKEAEVKNRRGYLLTKLELEPHLTPGEGAGSNIVFNLYAKRVSDDTPKQPKGTVPNKSHPWHFRPIEVGLAHELIHAWRNSSGRTIFGAETYEDEAMVIGDPNYRRAFPRFTENQIRDEMHMARRPENTRESMFVND